jgi:hypothetical protein
MTRMVREREIEMIKMEVKTELCERGLDDRDGARGRD